jgi:hypothetical protein
MAFFVKNCHLLEKTGIFLTVCNKRSLRHCPTFAPFFYIARLAKFGVTAKSRHPLEEGDSCLF